MNSRPQITQDMIKLYDDYTHVTLDRRGFMDKLAKLAGSTAAAATIAPLLGASKASAAMVEANDPRIVAEDVTYPAPDGVTMKGYLVRPANAAGELPGVIIIHENRGLNPHTKDVARRFALEGFVALAPDYLSAQGGTPDNEDQARDMFRSLERAKLTGNSVASLDYLEAHPATNSKIGAVGFCFGGGLANQLAVASPKLTAAVAFYGNQPDAADTAKIKASLLLHYASLDERVNAGIADYEAALKAAGVNYTTHMYEGANHAFFNDTSAARYHKEAADLAWQRTVDFFKEKLG